MRTLTSSRSQHAHFSRSRPRGGYASCSINFTILAIRMRWFAVRRSARLISCRRAQCLARDWKWFLVANLPIDGTHEQLRENILHKAIAVS